MALRLLRQARTDQEKLDSTLQVKLLVAKIACAGMRRLDVLPRDSDGLVYPARTANGLGLQVGLKGRMVPTSHAHRSEERWFGTCYVRKRLLMPPSRTPVNELQQL
jgi:hypothetical protein